MERNVLFNNESLINPESVDVQFLSGVYQNKSPCLMYEIFNKCPNKSECPYYHGTFCKLCYQYCLPTWNQAGSQAHLSRCCQNELRKRRWKAAEASKAKAHINADVRKSEHFNKIKSIQMVIKSAEEQKKMFFKKSLNYTFQSGKI